MASGLALAVYGLLLVPAAFLVWRRPVAALYAWIIGLAAHNAVMAALYGAGVRGGALTALQAWKEILLGVALARVGVDALRARRFAFRIQAVDVLALAFAVLVVAQLRRRGLLPQATRLPLQRHRRPAGELHLQHRLREPLLASARLRLSRPPGERLPLRRRVAARGRIAAARALARSRRCA